MIRIVRGSITNLELGQGNFWESGCSITNLATHRSFFGISQVAQALKDATGKQQASKNKHEQISR